MALAVGGCGVLDGLMLELATTATPLLLWLLGVMSLNASPQGGG